MRWLRATLTNRTIVVAYLEAATKSWPAWRKTHDDQSIARMLDGGESEDGSPYLVMELVQGEPLHKYAAKLDRAGCLRLFENEVLPAFA